MGVLGFRGLGFLGFREWGNHGEIWGYTTYTYEVPLAI